MDRHAVTSFLHNDERILLLKRSDEVSSYQGKWAGISGSLEGSESPLMAAYREIKEETGIGPDDLKFLGSGELIRVPYTDFTWVVHPMIFKCSSRMVQLNWENTEYRWVTKDEISVFDAVPGLLDALLGLLHFL